MAGFYREAGELGQISRHRLTQCGMIACWSIGGFVGRGRDWAGA
jgi:hypothetical protein